MNGVASAAPSTLFELSSDDNTDKPSTPTIIKRLPGKINSLRAGSFILCDNLLLFPDRSPGGYKDIPAAHIVPFLSNEFFSLLRRTIINNTNNIQIKAVNSNDSYKIKDANTNHKVPKEYLNKLNTKEFDITPQIAEDTVLGVLLADNAITKKNIGNRDIETLRAFATNASLAIEKSELYKINEEKVLELDIALKVL